MTTRRRISVDEEGAIGGGVRRDENISGIISRKSAINEIKHRKP